MYTKIKKLVSVFLVLTVLVSGMPILSSLESVQSNIVNAEQGTVNTSVVSSVYAVTADADLMGDSSNPAEHITIKTANVFPINISDSGKSAWIYFEVSGLDSGKSYSCELPIDGYDYGFQLENLGNGKAKLAYYISNPTAGPRTFTLKIFEANVSSYHYESATGLKYTPVELCTGLSENLVVENKYINKPKFVNINQSVIYYNVNISDIDFSIDPTNTTVEMLDSKGNVIANKPLKAGYLTPYKNQAKVLAYADIFTKDPNIYVKATQLSGSLFAGQEFTEGDYNIRIKASDNTYLVQNAIKLTNKPIVNLYTNSQGLRPATVGINPFYVELSINGGSLSDLSLHLKDKNGVEVATSSENFRVIGAYNGQSAVYKMSVMEGQSLKASESYKLEVAYKGSKDSFIMENTHNIVYVDDHLKIYKHVFNDEPNAKFTFKTVDAISGVPYKFELYNDFDEKLAEQTATTNNDVFNLDFTNVILMKDSHYYIKVYGQDLDSTAWKTQPECYYYINTYSFKDNDQVSEQTTFSYTGKQFILSEDSILPFEIDLLAAKYPQSASYTVMLINTADENDKIIASNVIKSSVNTPTSGETSASYVQLSGSFTLPPFVSGKKYDIVVTGGDRPLKVATATSINNTSVFASYGYVYFDGDELSGGFSIIKNGAEIDKHKFTIVLYNILGATYEIPASDIIYTYSDVIDYEDYYGFNVTKLPAMPQGWYFKGLKYNNNDVINIESDKNVFYTEYPDFFDQTTHLKGWYYNQFGYFAVETFKTDSSKPIELWLYDTIDLENTTPIKKITLVKRSDILGLYVITAENSKGIDFSRNYDGAIMYDGVFISFVNDRKFITADYNPTNTPTASSTTPASSTPAPSSTTTTATTPTPAGNIGGNPGPISDGSPTPTQTTTASASVSTPTINPTITPPPTAKSTPFATVTSSPVSDKKEPEKNIPAAVILKDIQSHWAKDQIQELIDKKVIGGYEDSTFKPDSSITRAELAVIIVKALGLQLENGNTKFKDNSSIPSWAKNYIKTAVDKGIINGYSDSTFKASQQCTRQEIVTMVMKAFELGKSNTALNFKDAADVQGWAKEYVAKAIELGIINGYEDKTFRPNNNVTRAEAAAIIVKALKAKKV